MLRIGLLGPLAVTVDGAQIAVAGDRARSVLALLALLGGRSISADLLIERCWGEESLSDPRASLHATIRRLRVLLGESAIATSDYGYALSPQADVDAVRFRRLLENLGTAERARLEAALALWRGEPFDAGYCDWLSSVERTQLVELWLAAVERRADLDLADGDAARVRADLHELVLAYPLRESLWARWLTALDGSGRRAEALEQYATIRSRIVDELGAEPGLELRAVFELLLADPDVVVSRPAMPLPQQLPNDAAHFRGRVDLLGRLDALGTPRADSPTQIVVLHGLGGSGKTSLAVHWAHRSGDLFPDGRLFVDLHGYGPTEPVDPATAAEQLLHSLGVAGNAIPAELDARSALLRSTLAGRAVLLVLDNARDEEQVRPLLPGTGAAVIVTSRSRLSGLRARDGAEQLAVGPLSATDAFDILNSRIPADPAVLGTLAERCGRLPLALRIAAEQVATRQSTSVLAAIADLDEHLDAFSAHDPATDLRTVLSWSYTALDPDTARFFRLLGVNVAPTVTVPSVAALTESDLPTARRSMRRLAELNLLTEIAPGRYRMHDLLRQYAAERCAAEDGLPTRRAAEDRLLDWYTNTAEAATRAVRGLAPESGPPGVDPLDFADSAAATNWYAAECDALVATVELAADRGLHARAARLAIRLWEPLYRNAAIQQSFATQRLAIESARIAGLRDVEATAINQLGTTHGLLDNLDEAEALFTQALALFQELGDAAAESMVHRNLSHMHACRNDAEKQEEHALLAVEAARRGQAQAMLVEALNGLAHTYLKAGRVEDALDISMEAVAKINRPLNRRRADIVDTLGQALAANGRHREAIGHFEKALRTYVEMGDRVGRLNTMVRLGSASRAVGNCDEARTLWQQALDQINRDADPLLEFDPDQIRRQLAELPVMRGD